MTPPTPPDAGEDVNSEAPGRKARGSSHFSSKHETREVDWRRVAYWTVIVACAICRIILAILLLPLVIVMLAFCLVGWTGWDRPVRVLFTNQDVGGKGNWVANRQF